MGVSSKGNLTLVETPSPEGVDTKTCSLNVGCGETKPVSEFYTSHTTKDKISHICKKCDTDRRRIRRQTVKKSQDTDRNYYYQRHYGITLEDYDRMYKEQGGRCWICQVHQVEFETRLCVDHDHSKEGKESVRGLLCRECNRGLGTFLDDPKRLEMAIKYLEKYDAST